MASDPTPYYQDDQATIYCGDCRDILPRLIEKPDLIVADPPYAETSLEWDKWPEEWPKVALAACPQLWCFGSMRMFLERRYEFEGWKYAQEIVWEKHNGSGFASDRFKRVHEFATHWYTGKWACLYHSTPRVQYAGPKKAIRARGNTPHTGIIGSGAYSDDGTRLMRSVILVPSCQGHAENETQKPDGIVRPLIDYSCPPGGLVIDLFCGSGTTLRVAKDTGRRAIGIDLREEQCEIAKNRLRQGSLFK